MRTKSTISGHSSKGCVIPFMFVWLTGWTAGTLTFDVLCCHNLITQYVARSYPATVGNVTESRIEIVRDDDGDSERAVIKYDYALDGKTFAGDKQRFGFAAMNQGGARQLVGDHPVGKQVTVYYQPDNPANSALFVGYSPWDFFLPLFLVPFNVIMIGVGAWCLRTPLKWLLGRRPGNIKVSAGQSATIFRVFAVTRTTAVGVTAGAVGFVGVFAFALGSFLFPPWPLIVFIWSCLPVACLVAAWRTRPTRLELNPFQRTLHVVAQDGWQSELRLADITSIRVGDHPNPDKRTKTTAGACVLLATDTAFSHEPTAVPCGGEDAAQWLREELIQAIGARLRD